MLKGELELESELEPEVDPDELLLLLAADEVVAAMFEPDPDVVESDDPNPEVALVPVLAAWVATTVPDARAAVMVVIDVLLVVPVAPEATATLVVSSVESSRAQRVALAETVPVEPISKRVL